MRIQIRRFILKPRGGIQIFQWAWREYSWANHKMKGLWGKIWTAPTPPQKTKHNHWKCVVVYGLTRTEKTQRFHTRDKTEWYKSLKPLFDLICELAGRIRLHKIPYKFSLTFWSLGGGMRSNRNWGIKSNSLFKMATETKFLISSNINLIAPVQSKETAVQVAAVISLTAFISLFL